MLSNPGNLSPGLKNFVNGFWVALYCGGGGGGGRRQGLISGWAEQINKNVPKQVDNKLNAL